MEPIAKRPVGRPRKTPKVDTPVKPKGDGLRRAVAKARMLAAEVKPYAYPIKPPTLAPGVVPAGVVAPVMATDANPYSFAQDVYPGGGFPGFSYLSQLATRAEYRAFASTMSTELTREWLEFTSKQDDDTDTAEKIKLIEEEFKRLGVRGVMQRAAEGDCYFGRAQIFIEIEGADRGIPLILDPRTVKQGSLTRVVPVEAIWTTPSGYNALDPAAPDFYKPSKWYMLGQEVHASRLMTVVTRPLPDILKPAFNFAGMSLSQLAEPYVDNWLRTRQSVADLINNFSITVLATAMDQVLQGDDDGTDLFARADLFTATRSNRGLMLLDKEREELVQVNTPLSGLHELQAQSQEHMCSVSRMPAIVLTGISPSGLNASSDGEIRIFYDWVAAQQEAFWREPLETILKCVQLSLFGEIDPDIGLTFVPLYQMTPKEESEIRAADGVTDCAYVAAGIIDPSEVRERLARDPNSGYQGLDTDAVIVTPIDPANETPPGALDAEFKEGDHPRAANGQFGSGGGSGSPAPTYEQVSELSDYRNTHIKKRESKLNALRKEHPELVAQHEKQFRDKQLAESYAESEKQRTAIEAKKSPEQKEKELAAASAGLKLRGENKERAERAAKSVETSAIAPNLTPDEISDIQGYYRSGDRQGAQAEGRNATVSAIEREAKANGLEIDHVSESQGGQSKSLYVKSGNELVRVSDHELPMTPERMTNREQGRTGRWDREVIVTDWQTTSLADYIAEIKGHAKA